MDSRPGAVIDSLPNPLGGPPALRKDALPRLGLLLLTISTIWLAIPGRAGAG